AVHLAQVAEVRIVHRALQVSADAGVTACDAADDPRRSPAQRVASEIHHGLTDARDGDQAIRELRRAYLRPAQAKSVDEHQLAHQLRLFEGDLQRDAAAQ